MLHTKVCSLTRIQTEGLQNNTFLAIVQWLQYSEAQVIVTQLHIWRRLSIIGDTFVPIPKSDVKDIYLYVFLSNPAKLNSLPIAMIVHGPWYRSLCLFFDIMQH